MNQGRCERYLLLLVAVWVAGCGERGKGEEVWGLSSADGGSTGGIVLEPNLIRGRVRFTNQNPNILTMLETDNRRLGLATATSTAPTGYRGRQELRNLPGLRNGFDFELSVEASAAGPGGMLYTVSPAWVHSFDYPVYSFQPATGVRVRPPSVQPEPTELEFNECVGVLQLKWGTDETCVTPVSVSPYFFGGQYLGERRTASLNHFVRGGASGTSTLHYYWGGANPQTDTRHHRRQVVWSVQCDEVVTVCTAVPGPEQAGSITGPWDILGEQPVWERDIRAMSGPDGNSRQHYTRSNDQRAPVSDPSRWWTLPNIVPGNYTMWASGAVRLGHEFTWFQVPTFSPATVVVNQVVTLAREEGGSLRYPFVMQPAFLHGSIRLADPYVTAHPGASSSLQGLFFEADYDSNGDGVPNYPFYFYRSSTCLRAVANNGWSMTSFRNAFDTNRGELTSSYEQVLVSPYDTPRTWAQERLRLGFWTQGESFITRPGLYDPARYRYGWLDLFPRSNASRLLGPGQSHRVDHEYCFNEVQMEYSTTGQRFYNPYVQVSGSFRGTDWRGQAADYTVSGTLYGIPAAIGLTEAQSVVHAATSGSVRLAVPQGNYTFTPGATLVNANGGTNTATFQPMSVSLGCGQRLKLVPPLAVVVEAQPTCAPGAAVTVRGRVRSSPAEVDRVWYQLNGGPEVTLCTDCGMDPSFSFPVALQACGNTVRVYAYTAGLPEPATGFQELVWDDPADGPSCPGSTCVNRPPVARCRNVVVEADSTCRGGGAVNDGSYDPEEGAVECTQTPMGPFALGRHLVTLTCTDSQGLSTSCEAAVSVRDSTPPALVCPSVPVLECRAGGAQASFAPPTAQDSCSTVSTVCTPASGSTFTLGSTAVTCTATDATGNQSRCTLPVVVADTQPPAIECPAAMTAECTGNGAATVVPPVARATDTCSPPQLLNPAEASFPLGTSPLTYSARDSSGNTVSCTSSLTVVDSRAPVLRLNGPSEMTLMRGVDTYTEPGATAMDGCSGDVSTRVQVSGTVNTTVPGLYSIRYTVADTAGNTATATRLVLVVEPGSCSTDPRQAPVWTATGNLSSARLLHTATLLPSGQVLVAGGFDRPTELYNPASGTWTMTGNMRTTHRYHTATLLRSGQVLVAGGDGASASASAEVYDPASGTWRAASNLLQFRRRHAAALLADGRVLVMGGVDAAGNTLASAEVYDPASGTWQATGPMVSARRDFTATALPGGQVLVAGGSSASGTTLASAEVYDPATGSWWPVGSLRTPRRYHTATVLPSGRVLVVGGGLDKVLAASAEVYDPVSGTWASTGRMSTPRRYHTATLLPSGQVLVAGGYDGSTGILTPSEVYDPGSGTWCRSAWMGVERYSHTATLLPSGQVLVAGGFSNGDQASAEVYGPSR